MELTVFERLLLLNVLPREADLTTLKVVRQLREDLSFSEGELAALHFRHPGETLDDGTAVPEGRIQWNRAADALKTIEIGPAASTVIVTRLRELDRQKKLTEAHLTLCDKFLEG